MHFTKINATSPDKVFVIARNVSGATISADAPVQWDVTTATDGNAITVCSSAATTPASLFVGINDKSLANSSYGLVQVYGFRSSCYLSRACAGNVPGDWLGAGGSGYLDAMTMSAATTSGWTHVALMETVAASVAYSSAAQVYAGQSVFIRAL